MPEDWGKGTHGGLFEAFEDNMKYSLVIIENSLYGIMLNYSVWNLNANRGDGNSFYSLSDESLIYKIEDVGDDGFYPVGCFIKPINAWSAVEDFFNNPAQKSDRIEWIGSDDIPWPEDW
ncbi:MAG: hypothetical protein COA95_11475 [Methylophaga sp.]|nr:MAG: hypothetical protein COA95_11475 [Methylophaga sp.]